MEEKSMKKSFSSLGFRFLIGTLVIYAVQMGVMTIVGAVKPEWLQDTTISLILAVLPLYLVGMPVLIAVVKRMPGEAPAKKSITPGQFVLALIMCFALMYCGNLVGTLITTVVGALKRLRSGQCTDDLCHRIQYDRDISLYGDLRADP